MSTAAQRWSYDQENTINNDFQNSTTSWQPGVQYQSLTHLNHHNKQMGNKSHNIEQGGHLVKRENETTI